MPVTPAKIDAVSAHKMACAAIAVADTCIMKAANELQAIETTKKANVEKSAQVLDVIKKAALIDINDPAAVKDMQNKLASHAGTLEVALDAIDNLVKLSNELDNRDKQAHLNGAPLPVQPTGGKAASLGAPAAMPGGTSPSNASGDYNQQSQATKRAADEDYLRRSGITPRTK